MQVIIFLMVIAMAKATSVTFVFDTTASMGNVLRQTRKEAYRIFRSIEELENGRRLNYILVPVNDPFDEKSAVVTEDKNEFFNALRNIRVGGGHDCPEPILSGITRAVELSDQNSHIFIFTDADPKEGKIPESLKLLLYQRTPKLYFIVTGKCNGDFDPNYENLARMTGGYFYNVNEGKVRALLKSIETNLQPSQPEFLVAPPKSTYPIKIELHTEANKGAVYEYDTFTVICAGDDLRHNGASVRTLNSGGLLVYEVNRANAKQHNGDYECVSSRHQGAKLINVKVQKRYERARSQTVPILKSDIGRILCPLDASNGTLKWERNGLLLNESSISITLRPIDVLETRQLACLTYQPGVNVLDRIDFNLIVGSAPTVDARIDCTEAATTLRCHCSCYITANLLSVVRLMNNKLHMLADTSINNQSLRLTGPNRYQLDYQLAERDFDFEYLICTAHSPFGSDRRVIELEDRWQQRVKSVEYLINAPKTTGQTMKLNEGDTLSLVCGPNDTNRSIRVSWMKNGHHLPNRRYIFIKTVTAQNAGIYKCISQGPSAQQYYQRTFNIQVFPRSWSEWSEWTACTGNCGQGHRRRFRNCLKANCRGSSFEVENCQLPACPDHRYIELSSAPGEVAWHGGKNFKVQPSEGHTDATVQCPAGFTWDLFYHKCTDINECKIKDTCQKPLRCLNTAGGFKCVACPKGFMGIKDRCLDIDECTMKRHNCERYCINVPGSFRCDCGHGYSLDRDGHTCKAEGFGFS